MLPTDQQDFLGRGLAFPLALDPFTGRFVECAQEESIRQSIYLILMTRKGERLMRPDFGCDIYDFAFATLDYTTLSQMQEAVHRALVLYEPRITNLSVEIQTSDQAGRVDITLNYVVRSTNNPYNLVYPFYIHEGIEL